MTDVAKWLDDLGLGQYAGIFADNDVDFDVLPELTDEDLKDLGVSLGHRKKILRIIREISPQAEPPAAQKPHPQEEPNRGLAEHGERRHLTVLFADMVGSTELSRGLDPEDYQSIIREYQQACTESIECYDGFIARYMGDGILAYFGYPIAHEDDAERSVRAAKDMIAAVSAQETRLGTHLRTRVGIATGEVVVGDIVGQGASEEIAVVGETPNLAARLQALAQPDTVVISSRTRRLIEGAFAYEILGSQTIKGFDQPL